MVQWRRHRRMDPQAKAYAAVFGPMQCGLKGVCAQCLQWQIDPVTGARTKAIYACSWQEQPMVLVDLPHLEMRQSLNEPHQTLNALWYRLNEEDTDVA